MTSYSFVESGVAAAENTVAPPLDEHQVLVLLVQLTLLIGVARILGGLFKQAGQPPVVGELLAGVVLGPSLFGWIAPGAFEWVFGDARVGAVVFAFAWIGVILLLVVIGYETDLGIIARFRRTAVSVSAGGFLVPMAVMGGAALIVPSDFVGIGVSRWVFAGFFALALSVSALPVVAKILQDLGLLRRNFGQVTLAAGMAMDAVGWLVLAALSGIALDGFRPDLLLRSFGGLVLFLAFVITVGRWLLDRVMRSILDRGSSVSAALTVAVTAALLGGIVTQALQLEAILGAFVVGILLASTRHQLPEVRRTLETVTASVFAPIFFAFSGLRVDVLLLGSASAVAWTVGLVVLAIVAKVAGTVVGARFAGTRGREALALGSGLSALGAMGIVVAIVALNLGVVSDTGYTVLVVAALVTSVLAPQLLRRVVRGWDVPPEEAARLAQEAMHAESEILGSRRILLPTRGGANSRFAARLLSSVFNAPTVTVLVVDQPARKRGVLRRRAGERPDPGGVDAELAGLRHEVVHVRSRDAAGAIAREARLGYDLMMIGASPEEGGASGLFSTMVDRVLAASDIPSVVVQVAPELPGLDGPMRVLVPVVASRASRAAEEFAYSLANRSEGSASAMHVVTRPDGQGMMFESVSAREATRAGHAVVSGTIALADQLGITVGGEVVVGTNAEEEITRRANDGSFDLVVLGAANRAITGRPFFGHRVHYILEHSAIPVAVVAMPVGGVRIESDR